MKKYLFFILLLLTTFAVAQTKHTLTKSTVTFQIKNLGVNTRGSIGGVKADIRFDPVHLDASTISATADVNTINTDNDSRDEHLKSDSYFDVAKYPKITIKSVSLKHRNGNNYTGTFDLTLKNQTNPIQIPFSYVETGNNASFKGSFQIKRTDYGVGGKSLVMSNDVTVTVSVETTK
jgi:polyisoprenoid-binding protein YceI